jgi:hypothetical protein
VSLLKYKEGLEETTAMIDKYLDNRRGGGGHYKFDKLITRDQGV